MKNKKLFDKTISILVNAYLKVTLRHNQPCACGIGNIIAANNNYTIDNDDFYNHWITLEGHHVKQQWYSTIRWGGKPNDQILSTNYSCSELKILESAFEGRYNDLGSLNADNDSTGYLGLMDMVDALIDIHQGTEDHKKETKELFKIFF